MNPSDLPWFAWILIALVGAGIAVVASRYVNLYEWDEGSFWKTIRFCAASCAAVMGMIGLIRFIKWVWSSG